MVEAAVNGVKTGFSFYSKVSGNGKPILKPEVANLQVVKNLIKSTLSKATVVKEMNFISFALDGDFFPALPTVKRVATINKAVGLPEDYTLSEQGQNVYDFFKGALIGVEERASYVMQKALNVSTDYLDDLIEKITERRMELDQLDYTSLEESDVIHSNELTKMTEADLSRVVALIKEINNLSKALTAKEAHEEKLRKKSGIREKSTLSEMFDN